MAERGLQTERQTKFGNIAAADRNAERGCAIQPDHGLFVTSFQGFSMVEIDDMAAMHPEEDSVVQFLLQLGYRKRTEVGIGAVVDTGVVSLGLNADNVFQF